VLSVDGAIISTDPRLPANDASQYVSRFVVSNGRRCTADRRPPVGKGVVEVEDDDSPLHGEIIVHRSAATTD
jgi:hypothetical protein